MAGQRCWLVCELTLAPCCLFFFSSRRRHTRFDCDWSSDVCSSDLLRRIPELKETIHPTGPGHFGVAERGIAALLNPKRLRRILTKMLDENEFLSPYGKIGRASCRERV